MNKIRVAFVCHFSNNNVRSQLPLKNWRLRNGIFKSLKRPLWEYHDFAIWVDDFIEMFQKNLDIVDLYVISPHKGLKKQTVSFVRDGINYHFYKTDGCLLYDLFCARTKWKERNNYNAEGELSYGIINNIKPDIICLCGAETPDYGSVVFRVSNIPIYLIPQTLLNDPKRIEMKVASQYRVDFEKKVFAKVDYVSSKDEKIQAFAKLCNPNVRFLPLRFPSHQPQIFEVAKEYDYVFYANNVMKNKGIEDVLKALAIVKAYIPYVRLKVIGGCAPSYRAVLDGLINKLEIDCNVEFTGKLACINDVFLNVQKAKAVVVPGITAALNSTIRESMFMHLPVVCYETPIIDTINSDAQCLYAAKMGNVEDLAKQMQKAACNDSEAYKIAEYGYKYALEHFSNDTIAEDLIRNCQIIVDRNG